MNEMTCNNCGEAFYYSTTEHHIDCPHCFSSVPVAPNMPLMVEPPDPTPEEEIEEVTENAT